MKINLPISHFIPCTENKIKIQGAASYNSHNEHQIFEWRYELSKCLFLSIFEDAINIFEKNLVMNWPTFAENNCPKVEWLETYIFQD